MQNPIFENHHITISKQELAELPLVNYHAEAVVIDTKEAVDDAVKELEQASIIGFDTETKPTFKKGVTHNVALMQLATSQRCFLFRLSKIGLHSSLISLLQNPDILKIGVSIHDDFHNLSKIHKIEPQNFIDLQTYVKQYHITDNSLSRIYAILFGERISKSQRLTNWEAESLTQHQIDYAAFDAVSCVKIYRHLISGEFNPVNSPYLRSIPELEEVVE